MNTDINGILCDLTIDDNRFVDVTIAPDQALPIVRAAVTEAKAIDLARQVIDALAQGKAILHHDPEGRIIALDHKFSSVLRWRYEQMRAFQGTIQQRKKFEKELDEQVRQRMEKADDEDEGDWWRK